MLGKMDRAKAYFWRRAILEDVLAVITMLVLLYTSVNKVLMFILLILIYVGFMIIPHSSVFQYRQPRRGKIVEAGHLFILSSLTYFAWTYDDFKWLAVIYLVVELIENDIRTYELNFKELAETAADSNEDNCISSE